MKNNEPSAGVRPTAGDTGISVSPAHDQHQLALQREATDRAARAGALRQFGAPASTALGHLARPTQIVDTPSGEELGSFAQGSDTAHKAGTHADVGRARALQEAIALLSTVMTQTSKLNGCSDEFLNGMAYGVATYGSAIKALAIAPAPSPIPDRPRVQIASWAQRFADMCSPDSPANPQKRMDAMLAEIDELRAALAGEYASIALENW